MKTALKTTVIATITIEPSDCETIDNLDCIGIGIELDENEGYWWVSTNALTELKDLLRLSDVAFKEEVENYVVNETVSKEVIKTLIEQLEPLMLNRHSESNPNGIQEVRIVEG